MSVRFTLLLAAVMLMAGCATTPRQGGKTMPNTSSVEPGVEHPEKAGSLRALPKEVQAHVSMAHLSPAHVYFDFNRDTIREADHKVVIDQADYLRANADRHLRLIGNTDERGSTEYNLALGQRRAYMVKKALLVLGIDAERIEAISYGKEKPLSTGHAEADWAQNRRVDFLYY